MVLWITARNWMTSKIIKQNNFAMFRTKSEEHSKWSLFLSAAYALPMILRWNPQHIFGVLAVHSQEFAVYTRAFTASISGFALDPKSNLWTVHTPGPNKDRPIRFCTSAMGSIRGLVVFESGTERVRLYESIETNDYMYTLLYERNYQAWVKCNIYAYTGIRVRKLCANGNLRKVRLPGNTGVIAFLSSQTY